MKKLCLVLVFTIILSSLCVYAEIGLADRTTEVLLNVKNKIDIPEDLTEFKSDYHNYDDKEVFSFNWENADSSKMLSVTADSIGRISDYSYYCNEQNDSMLTTVSKEEIINASEAFLKKAIPEAFESESDILVYADDIDNSYGLSFILSFNRQKDGIVVKNNDVSFEVNVKNDVITVTRMYSSYDFDAVFDDDISEIEDYENKYCEAFPIEEVYKKCDRNIWDDESGEVKAIYRFKNNIAGYIKASNGEVIEKEEIQPKLTEENAYSAKDMATGASSRLSEQEIREISELSKLISKEEIISKISNLPFVNIENLEEDSFYVYSKKDKYYASINLSKQSDDEYKSLNAEFDAKSGKILSLSSYAYKYNEDITLKENVEMSDVEKALAEKNIDSFINSVCPNEIKECELTDTNYYGKTCGKQYSRIVNGIKYINNGISISFDLKSNLINSFYLNFDEESFPDIENSISNEEAYGKILEFTPIKRVFIKNDDKYIKCFSVGESIELDALSGEKIENPFKIENTAYSYNDIEGHWAEDKIKTLAKSGYGLKGESFMPDSEITQEEILRLFINGTQYKSSYWDNSESVYNSAISNNVLTEEEKNVSAPVKREDAFVYLVRLDGLDRVAKLSDIFSISYADSELLSEGKIGYPAILSGMGIICGDGGYIRPNENITRAEAITMLYNYLTIK